MAAHMKRCLLSLGRIQITQVRYRRPNIQKPRPGIRERRLFEAITTPILPDRLMPEPPECGVAFKYEKNKAEKNAEPDPYLQFVLRKCKEMFDKNKMIIVCQALPLSGNEKTQIVTKLRKKNMNLRLYSNSIIRTVLSESHLVHLTPFISGNNFYVVSEEPRLADMVKIIRRVPQLQILGGVVDNYILAREGVLRAAKLPPINIVQGELASILNMSASKTHSLLGNHQAKLSRNLEQYIKDRQELDQTTT